MERSLMPNLQPHQGQKIDMRVIKTREAIAEAFLHLLETTEYTDITVTAIAQEARISRKTFYLHYSSIDELLREMVRSNIDEIVAQINVEQLSLSADKALEEFTRIAFEVFRDYPHLNSNLVRCMPLSNFLAMTKEPLVSVLMEHFKKNGITMPKYFDYWVSYYLGGLCSVYEAWNTNSGDPKALDELSRIVGKTVSTSFVQIVQPQKD